MSANQYKYKLDDEYDFEDVYELDYGDDDHFPSRGSGREHIHHPKTEKTDCKHKRGVDKPNRQQRCNQIKCDSQDQIAFCVPLSFDQELVEGTGGVLVPLSKLATNADNIRGVLKLKFNSSLSKLAYALYVFNATNRDNKITMAHLHVGGASSNGPPAVDLFNGPARNVNGLLIKGLIDNASIEPLVIDDINAINSVASIYQAIREGALYANIHSEQFTDGIIRGQIYLKNSYVSNSV